MALCPYQQTTPPAWHSRKVCKLCCLDDVVWLNKTRCRLFTCHVLFSTLADSSLSVMNYGYKDTKTTLFGQTFYPEKIILFGYKCTSESILPQKAKVKHHKKPKQNTTKNQSKMPQKAKIVWCFRLFIVTLRSKTNRL